MNTRASVAYGWGLLCLAGGGAYYFAKRSINADREERAALVESRRQKRENLRITEPALRGAKIDEESAQTAKVSVSEAVKTEAGRGKGVGRDVVEREREREKEEREEKAGFEATRTYRSRRGDRFS